MTIEATTTAPAPAATAATTTTAPAQAPASTTAAPAAAPAATPAPQIGTASTADSGEQGAFGPVQEFEPTGDAGLDIALAFVGKAGLGPDHPAMQAAANGDFSLLKAALAAKGVPGWEQHIALGEAWYERDQASKAEATAATADLVVQVAGSSEDWQAASEWASVNADPDEKVVINEALAKGGLAAEMAAVWLMNAFRSAPGVTYQGKSAVQPNAGTTAPTGQGALDGKSYGREVTALRAKLGSRMEGSPEYAALQRRRAAHRG